MGTLKLLIVGLDGATWDVIIPLINQNKLPTLRKLVKNGTYGILESTIPPVTGGAWLSLATGKTPGKTGVIDFLSRKNKSCKLYPISSEYFRGQSFWDFLHRAKIKIGIFNYPMLFPPYKINGFMVSGLGASPYDEITYPSTLKQELIRTVNKYEIYVNYHDKKYDDLDLFIQEINKFLNKFEKVIYYIIVEKDWDTLFIVFSVTDWVQHIMWKHIDENHPMYDPDSSPRYRHEFIKFWQRIDRILDKILKIIHRDTIIFLVSDHGFGPNDQTFNLLKWLEMKRYLVKRKKFKKCLKNITYKTIKTLLPKPIRKFIPFKARIKVGKSLKKDSITDYIDFKKSKAYCLGHTIPFGAIYINTDNETEKKKIKSKLIKDLESLSNDIRRKVDVQIYEPKKLYSGEKISILPDIIFTINNWRCVIIEDNFNRPLFEEKPYSTRHTGSHRVNGIFLAYGPGIKKGYRIESAKIYDVAPTILHIFGLPIPNDMDGRVLVEIFEPDSEFAKREPKYVDPSYYDRISERQKIRAKLGKIKATKKKL